MLRAILADSTLALQSPAVAEKYQAEKEFPHIIIDNFLKEPEAETILKEFPQTDDSRWTNYLHYNEKKYGLNKWEDFPPSIHQLVTVLNGEEFLHFLSELTGIKGLISDPTLEGGGLHQLSNGGFLNVHADFTVHPHQRYWKRRINVLIYLNKNWEEHYRGHLELWSRDMKFMFQKILPIFNRCVIFNTDSDAYHGHPDPIICPSGVTRKSIALYYFTVEETPPKKSATNYRARPGESLSKNILIVLDKKALSFYNWLKGKIGFSDDSISKLLRFIFKK